MDEIREVDIAIVGAGIQGLILARELRKKGLNIACITNEDIGGTQTMRSQFYLHRGHFYKDAGLAHTLNNTYSKWTSLIEEFNLQTTVNQSYIGFNCAYSEKLWLDVWARASLPFEKAEILPDILQKSLGSSFYQFPHTLFNGQSLIGQLIKELRFFLLVGNITKMTKCDDGLHEISINSHSQDKTIRTKHIILCAGAGNNGLIKLIDIPDKDIPTVQKRACQVLMLEGDLPVLSILVPGEKIFIAPQYNGQKTRWLYTFGTDPLIEDELQNCDLMHLEKQMQVLFTYFPILRNLQLKCEIYPATKIESAKLGNGHRPNQSCVHQVTNEILAVWPTKLTLAFDAAEKVYHHIKQTTSAVDNVVPFIRKQKVMMARNDAITMCL